MALLFATWTADLGAWLLALLTLLALHLYRKMTIWQRRGIPYAPPTWPYGSIKDTILERRSIADVTTELYKSTSEPVLGAWLLMQPIVYVNDPQLIREVLIKDFGNFVDRGIYTDEDKDPLTAHLFSLPGEKWRLLRAKLSPTFTSGKLKAMFQTLVDCGGPLKNYVSRAANGEISQVVEVRELVAQYTTNVIASAAFGLEIDCIADPNSEFRKYGRKALAPSTWLSIRVLMATTVPAVFRLLGMKLFDADVEEFFLSVVRQNMKLRENEKDAVVRKDFFQLLVQLRNGGVQEDGVWHTKVADKQLLTVNECAAQAFVFFLAGFETSSTSVSFALYELAKNPECQRRVQQEIDEVLARHGGNITWESVSEMKYLDWCFDETLRKFPPLPLLNRECGKDWHIPNTNMVVDAGTMLFIPVNALQMDPKYYPEPERFLPERFDPDSELFAPHQPYLPFGDGPRNCIGARFGKMQSKVGLVCMLQGFWYELSGNTLRPLRLIPYSFLMSPEGGVQLRVTKRQSSDS